VTKPLAACLVGHDGLIDGRVPSYAFPEDAVAALAHAARYAERVPLPAPVFGRAPESARRLVAAELNGRPEGVWLSPAAVRRLLGCYGIALVETVTVDGPESAAEAAGLVGLPAVLKATGPLHKTEAGGVRLGLRTQEEVRQAYRDMAAAIGDEMTGAIVQPMLPGGVEIIVGGVTYPDFGPLVMAGHGGVTSDLLADRAFRVPPLTREQAGEMLAELRCAPLLHGYRGRPIVDAGALADQVARVSRLLAEIPEVAELDLNPVIVTPGGATTVDARVRLVPCEAPPSPLQRRLR
ncbi:MAG: acetate--CoA ligase family protein, partial [Nonomuraea sp.]|nr:acetate--CoA ligase family protein [Nonomuraea sp.]